MSEETELTAQDFVARVRHILGAPEGAQINTLLDQAIREYFRGTVLEDKKMANALFKNIDFSGSLFADADLSGALIFDADFSNAVLADVNLTNASIRNANIDGLEIDGIFIKPLLDAEMARRGGD